MCNRIEDALLPVSSEILISLDVVIILRDPPDILHLAHRVVRAHYRVKFVERV